LPTTASAHLQSIVHGLLLQPDHSGALASDIRYVLVDEYQDTNYVQEQLLLKLTEHNSNLCVVGDEDQSLYRFRGATVRNILQFPSRFPKCPIVRLTTNYRSHRAIVERYDRWMASADWSNPAGASFRFDKTIKADPNGGHPDYPAVISIWGRDTRDESERFAELVQFLKRSAVIADYSQVALLLHSVRNDHSGSYLAALAARGIPTWCPRARAYFENDESGSWSPALPCSSAGTATGEVKRQALWPSLRATWTRDSLSLRKPILRRIRWRLRYKCGSAKSPRLARGEPRPSSRRLLLPAACFGPFH
jgi:superfamily I DNA/RNA helicase